MMSWIKKISTHLPSGTGPKREGRKLRRASLAAMLLTVFFFSIVMGNENSGTILISSGTNQDGTPYGNNFSGYVTSSADGRFVVFDSRATNINDIDPNFHYTNCTDTDGKTVPCYNVFLLDTWVNYPDLPKTEKHYVISRVYTSTENAADGDSRFPVISRDGRFIVFQYKDNPDDPNNGVYLNPGDINGQMDIFIYDVDCLTNTPDSPPIYQEYFRSLGYTEPDGSPADCGDPYIGLTDQSIDIVSKIDNQFNLTHTDDQSNADSGNASIAPYPRYAIYMDPATKSPDVIFESKATNLTADGNTSYKQIFLRKLIQVHTTNPVENHDVFCLTCNILAVHAVGQSPVLTQPNGNSYSPVVSADGNFMAFVSDADNLSPENVNGKKQVYLLDLGTNTVQLISKQPQQNVEGGNGNSDYPTITKNGDRIAFESDSTNLVTGDGTPNYYDVFMYSSNSGSPTLVRESVDSNGNIADNDSYNPNLSADGDAIAFTSYADNLVDGDNNENCLKRVNGHDQLINCADIFVRDTRLFETWRASITSSGLQADSDSGVPFLAGENNTGSGGTNDEGKYIFFSSRARLDTQGESLSDDHALEYQQIFYRDQGSPAGNPSIQPTYWTFYGYALPLGMDPNDALAYKYGTSKRFNVRFLGTLTITGDMTATTTLVKSGTDDTPQTKHFSIISNTCTPKEYVASDTCYFIIKYLPFTTNDHDLGRVTIPISDDRKELDIALEGYGKIFEYMPMITQQGN
jgi:Tol biopolymer transport system component